MANQTFNNWAAKVKAAPQIFSSFEGQIWFQVGQDNWCFRPSSPPEVTSVGSIPGKIGLDDLLVVGEQDVFLRIDQNEVKPAEAYLSGELTLVGSPKAQLHLHKLFEALLR